ncbi:MAG: 4-hydroxy-tetrahydrodipicolinate reductase [Planctomycetaceae bacterium]|jgi:4-hydroxy-tetrahydrodipicolinate reductase|nr:4-hydroxy-tetrahydrodipicolinate reductase [Planctomycetaceae bacterium]
MGQITLAIHGAGGRMGQRLIVLTRADSELALCAAVDNSKHSHLGVDVGEMAGLGSTGVPLSDSISKKVDAVIDFSSPQATDKLLANCLEIKSALVLATTGLSEEQVQKIHDASQFIPILWSPNTGLAVNVVMKLAQLAAKSLAHQDADVEILERHHRFKVDAPSGTALKLGEIIAQEMGQTKYQHGRHGIVGERTHGEIGYHAIRVGDNPGEHTIIFALQGELLEITVRVTNRDCYAYGALAAAKYIAHKPPGLYNMYDVLGI